MQGSQPQGFRPAERTDGRPLRRSAPVPAQDTGAERRNVARTISSLIARDTLRRSSVAPGDEILEMIGRDLPVEFPSIEEELPSHIREAQSRSVSPGASSSVLTPTPTPTPTPSLPSAQCPAWQLPTLSTSELVSEYVNSSNSTYLRQISEVVEQRTRYILVRREQKPAPAAVVNSKEYQMAALAPFKVQLLESLKQSISEATQTTSQRNREGFLEYYDSHTHQVIPYSVYEQRFYLQFLKWETIRHVTLLSGFERQRSAESPESILDWYNSEKEGLKSKLMSHVTVLMNEFNSNVDQLNQVLLRKMRDIGMDENSFRHVIGAAPAPSQAASKLGATAVDKENVENLKS